MRKRPDDMRKVFKRIEEELLEYFVQAMEHGVDIISYADSAGAVNILGPKISEQVIGDFTYNFLKKAEDIIRDDVLIYLCPKTTLALIGTDKAKFEEITLSQSIKYVKAFDEVIGKAKFLGERCINSVNNLSNISKIKVVGLV